MSSGLVGTIDTQSSSDFMENPYFEKLADFSYFMWIFGGLAPCGPSALVATKKASFGIKTCHLAIPPIMEQKSQTFLKKSIHFRNYYGQKVVFFGQKTVFLGVLDQV